MGKKKRARSQTESGPAVRVSCDQSPVIYIDSAS
jgi:hypothetical protein